MFKSKGFLVLLCVVVLCSFFLFSCGGGSESVPFSGEGGTTPEAQSEISKLFKTQSLVKEFYEELEAESDPDALRKTISFLKEQDSVKEAAIGEDDSIWIKYSSGVEAIIVTKLFEPLVEPLDLGPSSRLKTDGNSYGLLARENGKKAIILLPIDSMLKYKDESVDDIELCLKQGGYSVAIYRDRDVTVDLMRNLSDCAFIYMTTHGGIGPWGNIHIATGEIADVNATAKLWSYLISATDGITIFSYKGSDNFYFGVNCNFFDNYLYPGSFIYMNACSSLRKDNLADAFLNNGANIFIGWDNTSFVALGSFHNSRFFNQLAESGNPFKNAYNAVIALYYPCNVYRDDNKDGNYRVLFSNSLDAGDRGDATFDYTLNLKYKGNPDFVLNLQYPENSPPVIYATGDSDLVVSDEEIDVGDEGDGNIEISHDIFDADDDNHSINESNLIIIPEPETVPIPSEPEPSPEPPIELQPETPSEPEPEIEIEPELETPINNSLPIASIILPLTDSNFIEGVEILFKGTGTDVEDGDLSGDSLVWTSDKDGEIGRDISFSINSLSVNTHTITLAVTDSNNETGADSIIITISKLSKSPKSPWPMFQHDARHTGRSPYIGLKTNNLKWIFDGGDYGFLSSPIIGPNGDIYVSFLKQENGEEGYKLYAITSNGSLKWSYSAPCAYFDVSPAVNDDGVIFWPVRGSSPEDKLYHKVCAIDPNGSLKWEYILSGNGLITDAVLYKDILYICRFNTIYAINSDGSLHWKTDITAGRLGMPSIASDGTVYASDIENKRVYALSAGGMLKWTYHLQGFSSFASITSPVIGDDGIIYVGVSDGSLVAIHPDGSQKWIHKTDSGFIYLYISIPSIDGDGNIVWNADISSLIKVSADGTLKWTFNYFFSLGLPCVISKDGVIYLSSHDLSYYGPFPPHKDCNVFRAINQEGSLKWDYTAKFKRSNYNSSPAIGEDGTVYVVLNRKLYAFGEGHNFLEPEPPATKPGRPAVIFTSALSIISPLTDSNFIEGVEILFKGTCSTDDKEGNLTGDRLVWTSDRDGEIGRGESFSINDLSVGVHTITLTATDSYGDRSESIIITITESE